MDLTKYRKAYFDATNPDDEHNALVLATHAIETAFFYNGINGYQFKELYEEITEWPLQKLVAILCN